eukprot:4767746-Pyramimonas_sp.AAC.1
MHKQQTDTPHAGRSGWRDTSKRSRASGNMTSTHTQTDSRAPGVLFASYAQDTCNIYAALTGTPQHMHEESVGRGRHGTRRCPRRSPSASQ